MRAISVSETLLSQVHRWDSIASDGDHWADSFGKAAMRMALKVAIAALAAFETLIYTACLAPALLLRVFDAGVFMRVKQRVTSAAKAAAAQQFIASSNERIVQATSSQGGWWNRLIQIQSPVLHFATNYLLTVGTGAVSILAGAILHASYPRALELLHLKGLRAIDPLAPMNVVSPALYTLGFCILVVAVVSAYGREGERIPLRAVTSKSDDLDEQQKPNQKICLNINKAEAEKRIKDPLCTNKRNDQAPDVELVVGKDCQKIQQLGPPEIQQLVSPPVTQQRIIVDNTI